MIQEEDRNSLFIIYDNNQEYLIKCHYCDKYLTKFSRYRFLTDTEKETYKNHNHQSPFFCKVCYDGHYNTLNNVQSGLNKLLKDIMEKLQGE